jgi:hypothetical protein
VILGNVVLVVVAFFIWRYRLRRQPTSAHPIPIDDDESLWKSARDDSPLLPVHAKLSPFPMSHPPHTLPPLHASARLHPATEYEYKNSTSSPTSSLRKSSYPTSPASTRRPTLSSQSTARMSQVERGHHFRKMSYDLAPASPLRHASPRDTQPPSYFRHVSTAPGHKGTLAPARPELQVDLETALSKTVYDTEPETPSKTPNRRRRLRCTSEPRRLSSELDALIPQARGSEE